MRADPSYDPQLAEGAIVEHELPRLELERRNLHAELRLFHDLAPKVPSGAEGPAAEVERLFWYHTIELPDGTVTPGAYDHREILQHYGIPADLAGRRVLDVATHDGFWAFEFERRGADVTAIDLAWLSECDFNETVRGALIEEGLDRRLGPAFGLARRVLGSQVRRVETSVYDLDPAELGTFDLVHSGDLLLHLERPSAALQRIRRMTHDRALIVEGVDREFEGELAARYLGAGWTTAQWWLPTVDTLAQMIIDAGFRDLTLQSMYRLPMRNSCHGFWRASFLATV